MYYEFTILPAHHHPPPPHLPLPSPSISSPHFSPTSLPHAHTKWDILEGARGPILKANKHTTIFILSFLYFKTKLQWILEKNTLKKYDLQESNNNFKIKLKISFVNHTLGHLEIRSSSKCGPSTRR